MLIGIVKWATVVSTQNKETHHLGIVLLQHRAYGKKVAQGLGHLFIVHPHKAIMHPIIDHLAGLAVVAVGRFRLGNFVFVVRKLQILPAAVYVKTLA